MLSMAVRFEMALRRFMRGERGSGIIDYVAVGLVVLGLAFALMKAFDNKGDSLADAVIGALNRLFEKIK